MTKQAANVKESEGEKDLGEMRKDMKEQEVKRGKK